MASSVKLGTLELSPAPFVSTSYEYKRSNNYIIGGFLLVTLDGTIVGEDIVSQMGTIGALQSNLDCIELIIGCQGDPDFLQGNGRIRSVDINPSDQPYLANYSIVVAIETIDNNPVIEADPDFLSDYCLNKSDAEFLMSYDESLSIDASADNIALFDSDLGLNKSFIKASGKISASIYNRSVCGKPDHKGIDGALKILSKRAKALMGFTFCGSNLNNPFNNFSSWNKWLDTKTLVINDDGSVEWNFDLYLTENSCSPSAWIDISTDETRDLQVISSNSGNGKKTKNISGTIRGLCPVTGEDTTATNNIDLLMNNHIGDTSRLDNAKAAFTKIISNIENGTWPSYDMSITGTKGTQPAQPANTQCSSSTTQPVQLCYQRISSNVSTSVVEGSINFSAEFAEIDNCSQSAGDALIDVTIEESLPVTRYVEFIVPNITNSIIHKISDTPHEATVTVRGTLQGCDQKKIKDVMNCVDQQLSKSTSKYRGWLIKNTNKIISTYSYTRSQSFVKCDS